MDDSSTPDLTFCRQPFTPNPTTPHTQPSCLREGKSECPLKRSKHPRRVHDLDNRTSKQCYIENVAGTDVTKYWVQHYNRMGLLTLDLQSWRCRRQQAEDDPRSAYVRSIIKPSGSQPCPPVDFDISVAHRLGPTLRYHRHVFDYLAQSTLKLPTAAIRRSGMAKRRNIEIHWRGFARRGEPSNLAWIASTNGFVE